MSTLKSAGTPEQRESITRNQCDSCHWFVPWAAAQQPVPGRTLGTCHRHSPQYMQVTRPNGQPKDTSKWPTTRSTDHCGDFRISVDLLNTLRAEREAEKTTSEPTNQIPNPVLHGN